MWLIRAIVPIAAAANAIALMLAHYWFGNPHEDAHVVLIAPIGILYLLCTAITVKDGLGLAILNFILASIYFALAQHFPEWDFPWSGYAYTAVLFVPLAVLGAIGNNNDEKKVRRYFLRRQIGSMDDVTRDTQLSAADVQRAITEFLKSGELELMLEKPVVYRWTADRHYPEGMQTTVLEITL